MKRFKKAFTIIELLVVIAIIAVLSTIIFTSYESSKAKSRNAKRVENFENLKTSLGLYYEDHGSYPNPANTSTYAASGEASSFWRSTCKGWTGVNGSAAVIPELVPNYLATWPQDPLMSTKDAEEGYVPADKDKYCYIYGSTGDNYAFILHYSNNNADVGRSEVDWLSKPELVDPARSCSGSGSGVCHLSNLCRDNTWTMPTGNNAVHAWKIYSPDARCW